MEFAENVCVPKRVTDRVHKTFSLSEFEFERAFSFAPPAKSEKKLRTKMSNRQPMQLASLRRHNPREAFTYEQDVALVEGVIQVSYGIPRVV